MICPRNGQTCPIDDCLGRTDPGACDHVARMAKARDPDQPIPIDRHPSLTGRPRVGLWAPCLNQGGAETWQLALVRSTSDRLDWQGVAVTLPEARTDPAIVARTRDLVPVTFGRASLRDLASRCDVVISWCLEDFEPHLAGIEPKPKLVYCDHFPHPTAIDPVAVWCLRSVDEVVGVSELCRTGYPGEILARSTVIGNAIDPTRLVPTRHWAETRREWGVPPEAPVAGYYSRIDRTKRPDAMVRLVASLPEPWHVVIVGDRTCFRSETARIDAMVAELPEAIRGRIHCLDADSRAGDVLGAFDVLVVPAEIESFGLTLTEGIMLGLPVASTKVGLAALHPGLVQSIALDAPGDVLAAAVLAAHADGPRSGAAELIRDRCGLDRFGAAWSDLVERLAGAIEWPPDRSRIWAAVDTCPDARGTCGCLPGPPRICMAGPEPIEVRPENCFACKKLELTRA